MAKLSKRHVVPERDEPPGNEAAHWVMCRVLKYILNPHRGRSQGDPALLAVAGQEFSADLDLLDTIGDEPPPLPAGSATVFPPDKAIEKWLNEMLNVHMKADLEREFTEQEEKIERANEDAIEEEEEVGWMLAVGRASFSVGKNEKSDEPLIAMLRDPAVTMPPWVRTYLADRIAGRGPGQPPKTLGQRLDHNNNWLAERDVPRLRKLLRALYPKAPIRAPKNYPSIRKLAVQIAADRWRIDPRTLKYFMERGEKDERRLQSRREVEDRS